MTTTSAAALVSMTFRDVLGPTVMRRVWCAQIVSLLGDSLALFAVISVVTYQMHGTPQQVTDVQIAYMLPLAVLGPLSGVFVDRWPVKPTPIASDAIRAGLVPLLFVAISPTSVVFFAPLVGLSGMLADRLGVRAVFFLCAILAWVLAGAGKLLLRTERHAAGI